MTNHRVVIIGSGFSGLSASCFLARAGFQVTLLEKNSTPGGRASRFQQDGFVFDMGPSWYWMPDVFERFFSHFGKKPADFYDLIRLDPSYRIYWADDQMDVPAEMDKLKLLFESLEPGSALQLEKFLDEALYKYKIGMTKLVYKPGRSLSEFFDRQLLSGLFRLDVFTSIKRHIARYFTNYKLRQLLEFPVLFLGAKPRDTPALYSLMNYADIKLGTWYPQGGMYKIVEGMYSLAVSLGVKVKFDVEVKGFEFADSSITAVQTDNGAFPADVVLASADYHHVETKLLPEQFRSYSADYWKRRKMAPSSLIYFIGIRKKLTGLLHHTLFFDTSFEQHAGEIYDRPAWPEQPLFYVSCASKTDPSCAPEGHENLFILIPVSVELDDDTPSIHDKYFELVVSRLEEKLGEDIRSYITFKRSYSRNDFITDYNAFKGNAYGLANTLLQTANLKPSIKSRKVENLYFAGQLTVPGPGVPPAIISGEVAANEIIADFGASK